MPDGSIIISTKIDQGGFQAGRKQIESGLSGLKSSLKSFAAAAGVAFGVSAIINFGKSAVEAANNLENALTGLQSVAEGMGRSFKASQSFINDYISDGLIPATNATAAYKNLLLRGYDDSQIQQVLTALKDSAAYGRQSSYTLGQAVESAAEGLKNENSILVDNAGVTKNVAKMWDEYAKSIGTTANNLTQQQKIQAEVNGIMRETRFQTGDAAKVAGSFSGQLLQLQFAFNNLKVAVGNAIKPIVAAVLPYINALITGFTRLANVVAQVSALLFGKQVSTQNQVADSAVSAAAGQDALAKSTKKAAAAAKKAQAPFDELQILQSGAVSDSGVGDGAGGGISFETQPITSDSLFGGALEEVSDKIKAFVEAFKEDPIQAVSDAIWGLIGGLAKLVFHLSKKELSKTQLDLLSVGLETLIGALLLSTALKLPFPLAVALSALATSGLVSLLGKDAAIAGIASALTGLSVGLMAYKLTGRPLLAIALGAISAALVFFLERKTEINLVTALLIGISVALLSFTKFNFGFIASGLMGVSAALFALAAFNDFAAPLKIAIVGLAGAFASLTAVFVANKATVAATLLAATLGNFTGIFALIIPGIAGFVGLLNIFIDASPGVTMALSAISVALGVVGVALAAATGGISLIVTAIVGLVAAVAGSAIALSKDALPEIERFGDGVSEETQEIVGEFMDLHEETTVQLKQMMWSGEEISGEMASKVTANYAKMREQAVSEISNQKTEAVDALNSLFKEESDLYGERYSTIQSAYDEGLLALQSNTGLTQAEYDKRLAQLETTKNGELLKLKEGATEEGKVYLDRLGDTTQHYTDKQAKIEGAEEEIRQIMKQAAVEGRELTQEENDKITALNEQFLEDGVVALTENEVEQKVILERMKQNAGTLSAQQASDVVKNSLDQKEGVIKEAEEQYDKALAEAVRLREKGTKEANDQADEIVAAAERQKADTIKKAEEMHDEVVREAKEQSGEHVDEVDWETGEVKSKWEVFWGDVETAWSEGWEDVKATFSEKWDSVKKFFDEKVFPIFTKDYWMEKLAGIKEAFKDILEKTKEAIKTPINGIIDFINKLITGIANGLNSAIEALNKLNITMPDWLPGDLGGKKLGFNIPKISASQIPKLATGAVIPPRSEFLAILGDQKSGNNIEAPEGLIRQIIREEMAGMQSAGGQVVIPLEIDGREFGRAVVDLAKKENRRRGTKLVTV